MAHGAPNPDDWLLVNHPNWEKQIKDRFGLFFLLKGETTKRRDFFNKSPGLANFFPVYIGSLEVGNHDRKASTVL